MSAARGPKEAPELSAGPSNSSARWKAALAGWTNSCRQQTSPRWGVRSQPRIVSWSGGR
jgi:hypothetical protein